jgi:hypothetical protein
MPHTAFQKLSTDWRFQVTFGLLAVAISVVISLVTGKVGAGGLVLSVLAMLLGGAQVPVRTVVPDPLASPGHFKLTHCPELAAD